MYPSRHGPLPQPILQDSSWEESACFLTASFFKINFPVPRPLLSLLPTVVSTRLTGLTHSAAQDLR